MSTLEVYSVERQFVFSRHLLVRPWTSHRHLNAIIKRIELELLATEKRYRRSGEPLKRFRNAVRILVTDLVIAAMEDPSPQISVSRDDSDYKIGGKLGHFWTSTRQFNAAYDGLKQLGYFREEKVGCHALHLNTKIRATSKLLALITPEIRLHPWEIAPDRGPDLIQLRDYQKHRMRHLSDSLPLVQMMRYHLELINATLLNSFADIDLSDTDFKALARRMASSAHTEDKHRDPLNLYLRSLYRVFNNGSYDQGGRFYGGWWQGVPSEFRKHITINGERTVEVDFASMHPTMLYQLDGLQLPPNPYDLAAIGLPVTPAGRKMYKRAFNMMLNASPGGLTSPPRGERHAKNKYGKSPYTLLGFTDRKRPEKAAYLP